MNKKWHTLYVLTPDEMAPPPLLEDFASVTPLITLDEPHALMSIRRVDFIALRMPIHERVREQINDLRRDKLLGRLPVLGIGTRWEYGVDACITETISREDLRTVLELLCELHRCEMLVAQEKEELAHTKKELDQIADELVEVISLLLDLRIPEASRRGRRIAEAAKFMGEQLGLSPRILCELVWAAKLRELGKSGLPDEVLSKSRGLRNLSEQNLYERYPEWGGITLAGMPGLKGAAEMISHQLENFDGSGFPDGLKGEEIPIGSRILRVAAAFETLATVRDGSPESAMEILDRGVNHEYDPLLVRLMAGYLRITQSPDWDSNILRVPLNELQEGQTLAEDLWTRSGVKLLPQGAKLTEHSIHLLLNYRATDPMADYISIFRPEKEETQ